MTTFVVIRTLKLLRSSDLSFYRYNLKAAGTIRIAGWVFIGFALFWGGLNAHSGWVRYHERAGSLAFQNIQIPDELALAQSDPTQWLAGPDRSNIADGRRHLGIAADLGFFVNREAVSKLAWLEFLSGDAERSIESLAAAAEYQEGQGKSLSLYYRGSILNRLGRYEEALTNLEQAISVRSDLVLAREEKGESLWKLGRKQDAVAAWNEALKLNPELPLTNNLLAGAAASMGNTEMASFYEKQADKATPDDAYFHSMLALRLKNAGMNSLAGKHFQRAIEINPAFALRFSSNK